MIEKYVTIENTVARTGPTSAAAIINAYDKDMLIKVINEDSGWVQLMDGTWILKDSNHVLSLENWAKENGGPIVYDDRTNKIKSLKERDLFDNEHKLVGSVVKVSKDNVTDPTTGNTVDKSFKEEGYHLNVKGVTEDGYLRVNDGSMERDFYIRPSDVQELKDSEKDYWGDVDQTALGQATSAARDEVRIDNLKGTISSGITDSMDSIIDNMGMDTLRGIFGTPYQFLPQVDMRIDGSSNLMAFGRKYAQKIVTRMPILVLQAGVPEFLKGYTKDEKQSIVDSLADTFNSVATNTNIDSMAASAGRYYSLKVVPDEYYAIVNKQCQGMASLLGIRNKHVTVGNQSGNIGDFDWYGAQQSMSESFGYYGGAVAFYVNAEPQVSESFSNGVTQSQLAAKFNEIGRMGTELQFLLGGAAKYDPTGAVDSMQAGLNTGTHATEGSTSGGIIDQLIGNIQTLISGGRMAFPEIWSDSQLMRSFNVTFKLDSPDCDAVSIYLNILVPLAHILGFVAPRSIGYNNYISPYLVRAYFKSMFHIDMGIITDCQIQKGDTGAWNQGGLPTQVTVTITIKDLYDVMAVALNNAKSSFMTNPAQLDYLANLCGINIATPNIQRTWALWMAINGWTNIKNRFFGSFRGGLTRAYASWNNLWETRSGWTM